MSEVKMQDPDNDKRKAMVEQRPKIANRVGIRQILTNLIIDEPFFGTISRYIKKKETKEIPTMAVSIDARLNMTLWYNLDFVNTLTDAEVRGVLKHEFYHLIFNHLTTANLAKPEKLEKKMVEVEVDGEKQTVEVEVDWPHKAWNIATDLFINSFLEDELPDCGVFAGKDLFEGWPKHRQSGWYYQRVMRAQDKLEEVFTFDTHAGWAGTGEPAWMKIPGMKDMIKTKVKKIVREGAREAANKSWGSIPLEMQREIKMLIENTIDWRDVLDRFVETTMRGDKVSCRRRMNRKYGIIHPGTRVERYAKILVAIDMSGSVSDDMLGMIFGHLRGLAEKVEFTVAPFDTEIDLENVFQWERDDDVPARRTRSGGTCFEAPTNFCNEGHYDGMIIATDLCAPFPGPCNVERLWLTDRSHYENYGEKFGEREVVIIVEDSQNR